MTEAYKYSLVPTLQQRTGIDKVRDTSAHAFVARSAEAEVAEGRYIYLQEARGLVENLIGYNLIFCLVDNTLPGQLSSEDENKIKDHFRTVTGEGPYIWLELGSPYVRRDNPDRLRGEAQDWDSKCLWVDIKFIGAHSKELDETAAHLPGFKEAAESFVFPRH